MVTIREYQQSDKNIVMIQVRLNIPKYFVLEEEYDLANYLDYERELYYVLLFNDKLVGCGGINFAGNKTVGKISWDIIHPEFLGKLLGTKLLKFRIEKLNKERLLGPGI